MDIGMRADIHARIMQQAGKGNPFGGTDRQIMNAMVAGGWARWSRKAQGMIELTDRAEAYAAKEKRWLKGRVA
ncbi:hypothetical protein JET14_13500 [Martelella lutilitoris]|uniref:Uncharacterized protein n=1 Tax=Martelella lutilitoris TaxID=2583532 RepID=A0A7T7HHQ4_9HYPH|nr:hypothetical protein [Martelella lutilitoris]QQM29339.1 hypothetical protein JET14_13500 [Martelella lutilitoris]